MQGTMDVMDKTGHSTTSWDPTVPAEVAAARATFAELTGRGYRAFKVDGEGGKGQRLETFDPQASKMVLVPQLQGG